MSAREELAALLGEELHDRLDGEIVADGLPSELLFRLLQERGAVRPVVLPRGFERPGVFRFVGDPK